MKRVRCWLWLGLLVGWSGLAAGAAEELVYLDEAGVVRWRADDAEVSLFGANYTLAWSSDYRAAGRVGADRKQLVEQDLAHFARMGWDGVRLACWADWEASDVAGNLIENDHLDVFDYAVFQAKQRGLYILFNPIHTYSAWWPDADPQGEYPGFAAHYEKRELGTNPAAIAAQQNFIRQFLNHVNPYTGVALKDEPQILFVEMINEPNHHAEDFAGSVDYINALVQAVRDTGCTKLTFHNISETFAILPPARASQVDGGAFGWYPTGLNAKHALTENYLRNVDDYAPLLQPAARGWPMLVYEFDSADMDTGYMYPAMARAMRGVGAQFAAMFAYDLLATAPTNGGWQTHWLNLVTSPKKALSAMIASEVMDRIPRLSRYGDYPANTRFGDFRVSFEEDLSELVTDEVFLYTGTTWSSPEHPERLQRIAGRHGSPVVDYLGSGAYFLDKLGDGVWRLEVFPDAEQVADPFSLAWDDQQLAVRLVDRPWPMRVQLPDLGETFQVQGLNEGNGRRTDAIKGRFEVSAGVYLLSRDADIDPATLPQRVGYLGLREHVVPPMPDLPASIVPRMVETTSTAARVLVAADVIHPVLATAVTATGDREEDGARKEVPLQRGRGYRWSASLPAESLEPGTWRWSFAAQVGEDTVRLTEAACLRVVASDSPVRLFDGAEDDLSRWVTSRGPWELRRQVYPHLRDKNAVALSIATPEPGTAWPEDLTAGWSVKAALADRGRELDQVRAVRLNVELSGELPPIWLTLLESDGTAWTIRLMEPTTDGVIEMPLAELRLGRGVLLPQGYPNNWLYWVNPAQGRGTPGDAVQLPAVEHLQLSLRPLSSGELPKPSGELKVRRIELVR